MEGAVRGRAEIFGVEVDAISADGLRGEILRSVREGDRTLIMHVNAHGLNLAYRDPRLRKTLNRADIVFCDGSGVALAARLLGRPRLRRFTHADEMWNLARFAEGHGLSLFFLGARPGVAERAALKLRERYSRLKVAGTRHGYFDKEPGSPENEAVLRQINEARPDLLIVGFGMPIQGFWLAENWERLDVGAAMTLGAVFDYVSGELRRGPRLLVDNGLESVARLLVEPRRLWRRYVVGNPLFILRVLLQRFTAR